VSLSKGVETGRKSLGHINELRSLSLPPVHVPLPFSFSLSLSKLDFLLLIMTSQNLRCVKKLSEKYTNKNKQKHMKT
jgi:hypothetical protein